MKYFKYVLLFLLVTICPFMVRAKAYQDVVAPLIGESSTEQITVYFFHGAECPHCAEETEYLNELQAEYKEQIRIVKYEVWHDVNNEALCNKVKEYFNTSAKGVPFTVIGEKYFSGYNSYVGEDIKSAIDNYLNDTEDSEKIDTHPAENETKKTEKTKETTTIPLLGKVDKKSVSLPIVAIILGALDGFNPCAMWILLFLINMLFTMKNRKRMWILGFAFLFTSAFVYFLAMLGLNVVLSFTTVNWIRALIGCVALIGGIINIRSYIKTKNDGCHIVDNKKRNKYFTKIKKFTSEKSFLLALFGVITLAASVNLVELACSAGFPALFVELLNINELSPLQDILYIILYIIFFLLDDVIVFVVAMTTLKLTGISTKYNRFSHLIGGLLMIIMGILLILKPEWLMFNFS